MKNTFGEEIEIGRDEISVYGCSNRNRKKSKIRMKENRTQSLVQETKKSK